jgi:GMP synthase-like glutamine amidotransferase
MLLLVNNSTEGNVLSYIFQLRKCLKEMNIAYIETNKIDPSILKMGIKGMILSGSPMRIHKNTMPEYDFDVYYMLNLDVPVLGICFGCQLLTIAYGGELHYRDELFCETAPVEYSNHPLFKNLLLTKVEQNSEKTGGIWGQAPMKFCFNDLPIIPKHSETMKEIAWINITYSKTNKRERKHAIAYEFKKGKIFGILGHPEIHKHSWQIYKNFADNICSTSTFKKG